MQVPKTYVTIQRSNLPRLRRCRPQVALCWRATAEAVVFGSCNLYHITVHTPELVELSIHCRIRLTGRTSTHDEAARSSCGMNPRNFLCTLPSSYKEDVQSPQKLIFIHKSWNDYHSEGIRQSLAELTASKTAWDNSPRNIIPSQSHRFDLLKRRASRQTSNPSSWRAQGCNICPYVFPGIWYIINQNDGITQ